MRLYSYDRTSDWDFTKVSNEAQWEKCKTESCRLHQTEPIRFFDYGKSGGNDQREGLQKLIQAVKSSFDEGKLFIWRYDRLFRKTQKALEFVKVCHAHNIQIISISEPLPAGQSNFALQTMFVQLLFTNAAMQREATIENIRNGMEYRRSKGQYIGSSVPFGYRLVNGKIQQDEQEAKAVKRLFDLYVNDDMGYKRLAETLNHEGYAFRDHPFKVHNIWSILYNSVYCGVVKGGSFGQYNGNFTPIVTTEQFENVKQIRKSRCKPQVDHRKYLLRQKIVCPNCGWKLSPMRQWNYRKTKPLHYYHCANRECQGIYLPADTIESQVIRSLKKFVRKDEVYQGIVTEIDMQLKQLIKQEQLIGEKQNKNRKEVLQQFEDRKISLAEMKNILNRLDREKKQSAQNTTIQDYQAQLDRILNLTQQSAQQVIIDQVREITVENNKRISGIYLQNVIKNIYSE